MEEDSRIGDSRLKDDSNKISTDTTDWSVLPRRLSWDTWQELGEGLRDRSVKEVCCSELLRKLVGNDRDTNQTYFG